MSVLILAVLFATNTDAPKIRVGIPAKIENLVLAGSELEVKPLDDRRAKVVVRITSAQKHGTAHRYDLTYYALEPGTYNLIDFLQRKDGTPIGELAPITFVADSSLPPGQVLPAEQSPRPVASMGGYKWWLIAAGIAWLLVMLAIIFVGRKKPVYAEMLSGRPVSLADRLRPLVERGLAGQLSLEERADLERSLIGFWTRRLQLEKVRPAERFARLRSDLNAGPLLEQLESWLHKPGPQDHVDLAALLRPYKNMPADALDEPEVAAR
jgi:hypothetical protein